MLGSTTGADGQRVFLHLDNAANAGGYETPAITRTFTVTSTNQVYQLALNYALMRRRQPIPDLRY